MAEIAIFGGTFDPPTKAHQAIIEACLDRPDIDEVWIMPSRVREDKPGMSSEAVRLVMLEHLAAYEYPHQPRLIVSDFELNLPAPTQTAVTAKALDRTFPEHAFWFVFGTDSYAALPSWEGGAALQRTLGVLLVGRNQQALPPPHDRLKHLTVDDRWHDVSSTSVRRQLRDGCRLESVALAPSVKTFIARHGLYAAYNETHAIG